MGNNNSQDDCQAYVDGYPGKEEPPLSKQSNNLMFYTNQIPCEPDNLLIDQLLETWYGDYDNLERSHGYIQWIFPIREHGMNPESFPLTLEEAKGILNNEQARARVVTSYKLMLDFYGIQLENEQTGELLRAPNCESRFNHLNHSFHNFLRLTRILKSLGELGYEHYKKHLVLFLLQEIFIEKTLPRLARSCQDFWIPVLKNEEERLLCKQKFDELSVSHRIITDEDRLDQQYASSASSGADEEKLLQVVDEIMSDQDYISGYNISEDVGLDIDENMIDHDEEIEESQTTDHPPLPSHSSSPSMHKHGEADIDEL